MEELTRVIRESTRLLDILRDLENRSNELADLQVSLQIRIRHLSGKGTTPILNHQLADPIKYEENFPTNQLRRIKKELEDTIAERSDIEREIGEISRQMRVLESRENELRSSLQRFGKKKTKKKSKKKVLPSSIKKQCKRLRIPFRNRSIRLLRKIIKARLKMLKDIKARPKMTPGQAVKQGIKRRKGRNGKIYCIKFVKRSKRSKKLPQWVRC